ncbi:MAG: hypothetical protein AB1921_12605 [Thermodesulfobacteriota bacterium]
MRWIHPAIVALALCLAVPGSPARSGGAAQEKPSARAAAPLPCSCPDSPAYPARRCRQDAGGFSDRFSQQNPRWNWGETEGSGYHRLSGNGRTRAVELGIGPGGGPEESDSSFEERALLRRWGKCRFRIRCSGSNDDPGAGTMGWGVWRPGGAGDLDAVWFLSCSGASDPDLRGFQAMVILQGAVVFQKTIAVDLTLWHDYGLEIAPAGARFLVDGRAVAESGPLPPELPCMKTVCWIDNKLVHMTKGRASVVHGPAALGKSLWLSFAEFRPTSR